MSDPVKTPAPVPAAAPDPPAPAASATAVAAPVSIPPTAATKQAFESALFAAKTQGRIDLEDYVDARSAAVTADDAAMQALTADLNKGAAPKPAPATIASATTQELFRYTLSQAARHAVLKPNEVAEYQKKSNGATEEQLTTLINTLELKIKRQA